MPLAPIESPWLATFGGRLGAFLIDVLAITVGAALVAYQIPAYREAFDRFLADSGAEGVREMFLKKRNVVRNAAAVAYLFYAAVMSATPLRGTVGKWCLRIQVVDAGGGRLPLVQALRREGAKMISILPAFIGCVAALFDSKRRAWHDRFAGTLVVRRGRS